MQGYEPFYSTLWQVSYKYNTCRDLGDALHCLRKHFQFEFWSPVISFSYKWYGVTYQSYKC